MRRLYVVVYSALHEDRNGVQVGLHIDYTVASTGDEASEYGWEKAKKNFPNENGFSSHRVMIRTVDDKTIDQMMPATEMN